MVEAEASFVCESCGRSFELAPAVRARYPRWTPRECRECRDGAAVAGAGSRAQVGSRGLIGSGGPGGSVRRGRAAGAAGALTSAEVLRRFSGGPEGGLFTDGSSSGNPGPGGWGAVLVRDGRAVAERHGREPHTTNNRMELTAIIEGLSMLPSQEAVDVYSDSRLVVDTITKWAAGWEARGWRRKGGEVKNLDLVQRAYALAGERPRARIQWIRAHDGSRWNEYADALATAYLRDEL